jgi:hypothetical protein
MGAGDLGLVGRILRIFPVGGAWGEKEVARRWGEEGVGWRRRLHGRRSLRI